MVSDEVNELIGDSSRSLSPRMTSALEIEDHNVVVNTSDDLRNSLVHIPTHGNSDTFSWRKLWAFMGPGFLVS